jgi:protein-disulfide isomerase
VRGGPPLSDRLNRAKRAERARPGARTPTAALARPASWAALALAVVGIVLAGLLTRLHAQAHAGIASFCAISDVVNCDRVATSQFSVLLGLPVAVWGVLGYALAAALAGWSLTRRRPHPAWPGGLLFVVAAVAVCAAVVLAAISELVIGAWCLLCIGSWAVSIALLVAAILACRPVGVRAALRADLAALRARRGLTALAALVGVAVVAVAAVAYPRYWERAPAPVASAPGGTAPAPAAGPITVVSYSDYECPFCARAHEETRALLVRRPDVRIVRRQFPLDASCNPAVKKVIHPTACALARAALCADEQGRFDEMDDALFRNQTEQLAVKDVAARIGLDVGRFRVCLDSTRTTQRLAADIAAGIADGVRATPTYIIGHTAHAGRFPTELLPPPGAAAQGAR